MSEETPDDSHASPMWFWKEGWLTVMAAGPNGIVEHRFNDPSFPERMRMATEMWFSRDEAEANE